MKHVKSYLAALIGIWFIVAPWALGYSDDSGMLWTSVIVGAVQTVASLLSIGKSGWGAWQSWISLLAGVWFIVFPFVYTLDTGTMWTSIVLGAVTVLLNLWILASKE